MKPGSISLRAHAWRHGAVTQRALCLWLGAAIGVAAFAGVARAGGKHVVTLNSQAQGGTCVQSLQPVDATALPAPVQLSARTGIAKSAKFNADADGVIGKVSLSAIGGGVRNFQCSGSAGVSGNSLLTDEELQFTFTRPIRGDSILLRTTSLSFGADDPVLFISSAASPGFDYVVPAGDLLAAYESVGASEGRIDFASIAALPQGLWVDSFRIRETSDDFSISHLVFLAPPSADLSQVRNGSAGSPNNPGVWVNGNAGSSNSHYIEGQSVPYRAVMTDLPLATPITITLGYDIKHSDRHALDYLTHYNRLEPHMAIFGHAAETINPLSGVSGVSMTTTTFPIPAPDTTNSVVPGQPATSFNALPLAQRVFTLFGGTITNVAYDTQGDLTASQSETRIEVTFTVDSATAVLAWGGHIGSRLDWGYDETNTARSAGGISGSPYHMRQIDWTLNNLGNQDRSLSAGAVVDLCLNVVCGVPTGPCDGGQTCDPNTGNCVDFQDPPAGTLCEADGSLCTNDQCNGSGSCVTVSNVTCPGPTGACDGGTACNPATGGCDPVADPPLSTPCNADGDACTNDHCDGNGNCVFLSNVTCPGPTNSCDGGQTCSGGVCVNLPDTAAGTPCEADGDLCTIDQCNGSGMCVQQSNVSCSHLDTACSNAACNPATGACVVTHEPLSTPCEADGNLCTNDHCNGSGTCVFLSSVSCPGPSGVCDGGQSCNPATGMCQDNADPPLSTPCEADGDLCTIDHCSGTGSCVTFDNVSCPGPTGVCDGGQSCNPATGTCQDDTDPPLSTPCEADGDLCTIDHCNGSGACVTFDNVSCPGSTGECDAGQTCNPATGTCQHNPDPPLSTPCEADGDLCTIDHCDGSGSCVTFDNVDCPGPKGFCDGGMSCDPGTGSCVNNPDQPLSTPCERDGNLCTIDHCNGAGACVTFDNVVCPGSTGQCDAGQQCDPGTGNCVNLMDPPVSTPCEADGDFCTLDHCDGSGSCVNFDDVECAGPSGFCDAGEECDPATGACEDLPDPPLSTPCEADGDLCTIDHCSGFGFCVTFDNVSCPGPTGFCDAGQSCNPVTGTCQDDPDPPLSTPCEADGNLCTIDHCDGSGACVTFDNVSCPGSTGACDAGQACNPMTGTCQDNADPPLSTPCEADGNLCTIDHCDGSGVCVTFDNVSCPGPTGVCDGGQSCNPMTGTCQDNADPALSTPCEADGNLCTIDHCDGSGACVTFDNVSCPGPTGACDAGQSCNPMTGTCQDNADPPLSTPCEADGNLCTNDHCDGQGSCVYLSDVSCPGPTEFCDGGQSCNPATGTCVNNPDAPLSTPCEDDGNLCTIDHCNGAGQCVQLDTVECLDPVPPCEGGTACNPSTGGCEALPDAPLSTPCEADGNLCTTDHCDGKGSCVFLDDVDCAGPVPPCEGGEMCDPLSGSCEPLPDAPKSTPCEDDGNLCTIDHCDGTGNCAFLADVFCDGPVPPCEGGTECNPSTGMCDDLADAPLSTPCDADLSTCTQDHCDGNGNCVLLAELCGGCCDGDTGDCTDELFAEECVGDQATFFQGQDCATVIGTGECVRHSGACCDTSPGSGGQCVDGVFPEDCDPTGDDPQRTWYKDQLCSEIGPCLETAGACCDRRTGTCTDNLLQAQCACTQCTWTKGASCDEVSCIPALGACCDTGSEDPTVSYCTQTTLAACNCEKCTWYKDSDCSEITCDPNFVPIPTVSEWGLVVLALMLLIGGKVYFGRRPVVA